MSATWVSRYGRSTWRPDLELRMERADRAARLRGQGMTLREIGWELGVGHERARQILKSRWALHQEETRQRMLPLLTRVDVHVLAKHPGIAEILAAL